MGFLSNSRALLALLGCGIVGKMHRGVKGTQSCLCSCTARLCRKLSRTQQHSGRCDRTCLPLCTASCTGDLRLALLFALVPAADPSPAFSPLVPPKIFKNYLYYYFYFIIMRGEHVCTYVSMWRAEDSFRFFLFRGIQDRTQVLRLTRQALSHLAVSMAFSLFLC